MLMTVPIGTYSTEDVVVAPAPRLALADDPVNALFLDKNMQNGLNVHKGQVTYKAVADALGYRYIPADEALKI